MRGFEDCQLSHAEPRHLSYLVRWINSGAVDLSGNKKLTTIAEQEVQLEDQFVRTYVGTCKGEPFGFARTIMLNRLARTRQLIIYADLNKCADGDRKIIMATAEYEFGCERIEKLVAEVLPTNQNLSKVYDAAGFKAEVKKRQHRFSDGKFHNVIEMAILASDYESARS